MLIDLATAVALGGDCAADLAVVRAQPQLFGPVASDPTVSRLVAALAADIGEALPAIRAARAVARQNVWSRRRPLAGNPGSRNGGLVVVDIDSTVVAAHSDKQGAQPTFKRTFGFVPMCAFVDHGEHGTGETFIAQLRPGKASPWAKTDHVQALDAALVQLPAAERPQVLVHADSAACSKTFLHHITDAGLQPAQFPRRTRRAASHHWANSESSTARPGTSIAAARSRLLPAAVPDDQADREPYEDRAYAHEKQWWDNQPIRPEPRR